IAFVEKVSSQSHIIAFENNENLSQVLEQAAVDSEKYGKNACWDYSGHIQRKQKTLFDINAPNNNISIETSLIGRHNIMNTLACAAAAHKIGIPDTLFIQALKTFSGIKRRQEIRGVKNGITIMDDFAHHPSAVKETINAVKPFYQKGRVIAVFEPRTNTSMRNIFQDTYPDAFIEADMACICEPALLGKIEEQERVCAQTLVQDMNKKGIEAYYFKTTDAIIDYLLPRLKENDLVLIMSNGGFE
ncbi:MAG: UDP-N-acetylmuramate:L-alanyl-gamma-D-glutamyl-meso-diaminopimelate ligase, partial [Desulfobacteraceae bacterium]|nr:UDP-N-acetylmuramate:L-alanyl-gamma-D-glutamyl-meso-diaminopimelate ligase [Desulfobacteraceae bacterium]